MVFCFRKDHLSSKGKTYPGDQHLGQEGSQGSSGLSASHRFTGECRDPPSPQRITVLSLNTWHELFQGWHPSQQQLILLVDSFVNLGYFFSQISGSLQLLPTDSTFVFLNCKKYLLSTSPDIVFNFPQSTLP